MVNPELIKLAAHYSRQRRQKVGFVPSDAVAGGGGGAPPGAPPPGGDPSGGGGAPPASGPPTPPPGGDPSGGGGGMAAGVDPATMIQQAVQQGVQTAMGGMGGGAGGGAGGGDTKPPKPDIQMVATDVFQLKKMLMSFMRQQGFEPPMDILDGPGRDPQTGMPAASPMGGSDPTMGAGGGGDSGGGTQTPGAIPPIQPMQGAFPSPGGGGGEKAGSVRIGEGIRSEAAGEQVVNKAAAVARMCRQRARAAVPA